jgi:hypothetical protein
MYRFLLQVNYITREVSAMAKNKQNKPKGTGKLKADMTAMADSSSNSRNSKTGYMEMQPNSKQNQLK